MSLSRYRAALFLCLIIFAVSSPSSAQSGQTGVAGAAEQTLHAIRTATPVNVDRNLDEEIWLRAPVASGFRQNEPREGEPATEDTEVRILYDDSNLYLGVFAKEQNPDDILVNELKKDFDVNSSDVFEV